jgi:hypothetical protein
MMFSFFFDFDFNDLQSRIRRHEPARPAAAHFSPALEQMVSARAFPLSIKTRCGVRD